MFKLFSCSSCSALRSQKDALQLRVNELEKKNIDSYWHHKDLEERIEALTKKLAECQKAVNEKNKTKHTGKSGGASST